MKRGVFGISLIMLLAAGVALAGCSGGGAAVGTLQFYANGEDFVRQGFVSMDGWSISFDHIYGNLADITAYQTDPPYDAEASSSISAEVEANLPGTYTVDLAAGDENAEPILVGQVQSAGTGHYNAISWEMERAISGPASGYSLVILGTAAKGGEVIDFSIKVEEEYSYSCGEYIGDERKGIVTEGEEAGLEMTFHFDHIFGDIDAPLDDHLNLGATGFEPFAEIAVDGEVDEDMAALETKLSAEDYGLLVETLTTLCHVGEGHCNCQ